MAHGKKVRKLHVKNQSRTNKNAKATQSKRFFYKLELAFVWYQWLDHQQNGNRANRKKWSDSQIEHSSRAIRVKIEITLFKWTIIMIRARKNMYNANAHTLDSYAIWTKRFSLAFLWMKLRSKLFCFFLCRCNTFLLFHFHSESVSVSFGCPLITTQCLRLFTLTVRHKYKIHNIQFTLAASDSYFRCFVAAWPTVIQVFFVSFSYFHWMRVFMDSSCAVQLLWSFTTDFFFIYNQ